MNKKQVGLGVTIWLMLIGVIASASYLPLASNKTVAAPFLHSTDANKALVFFGFTHCADVCPTSLAVLREVVKQRSLGKSVAQVVFIDIDNTSNQEQASQFAQQFHPSFIGYAPSSEELLKLKNDFGLNIHQQDKDIRHQGRTYLLVRKNENWKLVKTFNPKALSSQSILSELKNVG